jgi:hypothetical protein
VLGEGHAHQVADHAAPGAGSRTEPVRGQLAVRGRGALRGQSRQAALTPATRNRPRHHDGLPDVDAGHLVPDGHDLRDAFVADREGPAKRDATADARHHRVDRSYRDPELHRP